jgi:hypothetical protein
MVIAFAGLMDTYVGGTIWTRIVCFTSQKHLLTRSFVEISNAMKLRRQFTLVTNAVADLSPAWVDGMVKLSPDQADVPELRLMTNIAAGPWHREHYTN